ncbi:hypothetical protein WISP_88801 [Willisornis vidua]|uniref:Uncharacterized protein n=1 Tax=Willisornis vidua TaxID=1566151 RepID=A0ABQ9D519_9PASS|nr:hypothetical protein WISP_88801 [Willisornis vidua]
MASPEKHAEQQQTGLRSPHLEAKLYEEWLMSLCLLSLEKRRLRMKVSDWYLEMLKDVDNLKRMEHEDKFQTGIQISPSRLDHWTPAPPYL